MPDFGKAGEEEPCCRYKEDKFVWTDREFRPKTLSDTILYKITGAQFTMHRSSKVKKKGTFAGLEEKDSLSAGTGSYQCAFNACL